MKIVQTGFQALVLQEFPIFIKKTFMDKSNLNKWPTG